MSHKEYLPRLQTKGHSSFNVTRSFLFFSFSSIFKNKIGLNKIYSEYSPFVQINTHVNVLSQAFQKNKKKKNYTMFRDNQLQQKEEIEGIFSTL
ncbi:hypothetical protein GDO86_004346 [Hymenochirus boettgeri]|uniref:Uncharacterized protein n=1 Tax=Hymenochirus boettgeri TaxID=247094 RepID=A0A8T2KA80_9PIPI|nr:hypothetical protein GDO86_004346 [Hymenochirus boettgeri]